ncbi:TPA: hypothetical protein ACH3X3_003549 [Trebouxia sp. C0006]
MQAAKMVQRDAEDCFQAALRAVVNDPGYTGASVQSSRLAKEVQPLPVLLSTRTQAKLHWLRRPWLSLLEQQPQSLSGHSNDRAGGASDALHDTSGAGFLGVLAIHIGSIAVVIYNVARSKMAVTSYCIQALTPLALVAFLLLLKDLLRMILTIITEVWTGSSTFTEVKEVAALPTKWRQPGPCQN